MAPASTLQSRINQFETLNALQPSKQAVSEQVNAYAVRKPVAYPPIRTTNPLDDPISPSAAKLKAEIPLPYAPRKQRSHSPSPPNLGLKTSLIDLSDWTTDNEGPSTAPLPIKPSDVARANFKQKGSAPPLPPRIKRTQSDARDPVPQPSASKTAKPSPPPKRLPRDSLTVEHTYPPLATASRGHAHASSTSSFHSVSLSDGGTDGGRPSTDAPQPPPRPPAQQEEAEPDTASNDDSFSFVSSTAISSPSHSSTASHDWDKDIGNDSQILPERLKSAIATPLVTPLPRISPLATGEVSRTPSRDSSRRPPPPPPRPRPRPSTSLQSTETSDASSVFSVNTFSSRTTNNTLNQLSRPTPVPPAARQRFEKLFNDNLNAQRQRLKSKLSPAMASPPGKASSPGLRKGWRGISVDLTTNSEGAQTSAESNNKPADLENKLSGRVVKLIWSRSKLDKSKLRDIWNDCCPANETCIDRDQFVKSMWRIDEELRRHHNTIVPRSKSLNRPRPAIPRKPPPTGLLL